MIRPLFFLFNSVVLAAITLVTPGLAKTELLEVTLAREVANRSPLHPYAPPVFCEKDKHRDAPLPIIHASVDHQVVFWNRVSSTAPTILLHTWHKKTPEGWKPMAHVRLQVHVSSSFRIWSTKEIHPTLHLGEWMIVVSFDHEPQEVLCIARFLVEN